MIVLIVLGVGAFLYSSSGSQGNNSQTNSQDSNVQKITLGIKNANYYPNTITVKEGVPVEITLDSSVQGCLRSFNINDFGVHASSQNPSQTIKFTPTKTGTFRFACSMGMGYGTIIVQ